MYTKFVNLHSKKSNLVSTICVCVLETFSLLYCQYRSVKSEALPWLLKEIVSHEGLRINIL